MDMQKPRLDGRTLRKRHILMTNFPKCLSQPAWAALTKCQNLGGLENQASLPTALRLDVQEPGGLPWRHRLFAAHTAFSFRGNACSLGLLPALTDPVVGPQPHTHPNSSQSPASRLPRGLALQGWNRGQTPSVHTGVSPWSIFLFVSSLEREHS